MATYRATARGYVDSRIVEEGETFTTDSPKGSWMEEVEEKRKPGRPPKEEKVDAE